MKRETIISEIRKEKIIVIVRNVEKEKIKFLAEAMYKGGIRLIEITFSADGKSDKETAEKIKLLAEEFEGTMHIGAGTVLTERQVETAYEAGAEFIISPDTCVDVIRKTRELNLVSVPGALTPSEIRTAHDAGADFVKLFPITNLGTKYFKAVKAPLSNIEFLAVGGIDENNMREYADAGIAGFGIGSNIVNKKMIAENNWEAVTRLAEKYCEAVRECGK